MNFPASFNLQSSRPWQPTGLRFGTAAAPRFGTADTVEKPAEKPAENPVQDVSDEIVLYETPLREFPACSPPDDEPVEKKASETKPCTGLRNLWTRWKNRPNKEPIGKKLRRYVIETLAFYAIFGAALWGTGVCQSKYEQSKDGQHWFRVTHTFHMPGFMKPWFAEKPPETELPKAPEIEEKPQDPPFTPKKP